MSCGPENPFSYLETLVACWHQQGTSCHNLLEQWSLCAVGQRPPPPGDTGRPDTGRRDPHPNKWLVRKHSLSPQPGEALSAPTGNPSRNQQEPLWPQMNPADQKSAIKAVIQEAEQIPKKINPKKYTPRPIIMKPLKTKDRRILKAIRENQHIPYKLTTI